MDHSLLKYMYQVYSTKVPFIHIKYALEYLRPDFYRACSINSPKKSEASAVGLTLFSRGLNPH